MKLLRKRINKPKVNAVFIASAKANGSFIIEDVYLYNKKKYICKSYDNNN